MSEYKLNTDIDAFENELARSAFEYAQKDELLEIEVSQWAAGLLNDRPIDRVGRPVEPDEGRRWVITLAFRQNDYPDIGLGEADMSVSYIGGDHPLLLRVSTLDEVMPGPGATGFVEWFIGRCEQLWDVEEVERPNDRRSRPKEDSADPESDLMRITNSTHREIVRLWRTTDLNAWGIGQQVGLQGKTVTNVICDLRKDHGETLVPYRSKRRDKLG